MHRHLPALFLVVLLFSAQSYAQTAPDWDLLNLLQSGQGTTYMADPGGGYCGVPVEVADYDNDGFLDYAVAPLLADGGPGVSRPDSGVVYIFKGNGTVGGIMDVLALPPGQPLATIWGAAAGDILGTELFSADLNNDGISDLILGASGFNKVGGTNVGAVYILWGGPALSGLIDLAAPPATVTVIQGRDQSDRLGFWVEAGDINGDGIDDLLMSADQGDGPTNSNSNRGEAYVIYGGQPLGTFIDLNNPPVGLQMVTIYGRDNSDQLGSCMHSVDLDNDGYEEIIVSAALNRAVGSTTGNGTAGGDGPNNSRSNCGDTYIIWGGPSLPSVINISTSVTSMLAAGTLTMIYGADAGDYLGEELASGDVDNDGTIDLLIGAITADGFQNALPNAGDAVIVWGGSHLRGMILDIDALPPEVSILYGESVGDIGGDTLSMADVNGDGFSDIYFSEPSGEAVRAAGTASNAGEIVIIFGGPRRFPVENEVSLLVSSLEWPTRRIIGADAGDLLGYSMEGADFDGDGFAEIFPNAMRGDGFANAASDAGEVNILSGRIFSKGIVTLKDRPTIGSTVRFHVVGDPGDAFLGAFALSAAPSQSFPGVGTIHLANDVIFQASLLALPPIFTNLTGTLDPTGKGQYTLPLPVVPGLLGLTVFTTYITVNPMTSLVGTVGYTTSFTVLP